MKIGAHMSTSSGFSNVVKRTKDISANTFQIFSHNPRSWKVKDFNQRDFNDFKSSMIENGLNFEDVLVHSGYLINLSSPKEEVWTKSIDLMVKELFITSKLNIKFYNVHPGSHLGKGEEYAFDRIAEAIDTVLKNFEDDEVFVLLENVAKKGNNVGWNFIQLGEIMKRTSYLHRIGITYDTCHGFDSDYDIRSKDGVTALLNDIDKYIGLDKLKMIHLNDSKYPLGAAKDRHELIGKGYIGIKGFETFLSFDEILKLPIILETPGDDLTHKTEISLIKSLIESIK